MQKKTDCKHLDYDDGLSICRHPDWKDRKGDAPCIVRSAGCECDDEEGD